MIEFENPDRNNLDAAEGIICAFRLVISVIGLLLPVCLVAGYIFYLVIRP